jgi:DNA repair protein RecO (recombination protein O)
VAYHWTIATILRATRVGERDKRLVLFSRELGKITATVHGAAMPDARWSTAFEPFSLLYLRLYDRSHYLTIVSAEERIVYGAIISSLSRSLKAMALNQLLECVLEPRSEEPELFAAYVSALSHLNLSVTTEDEDKAFLQCTLDVLAYLGFGMSSLHCERCGATLDDEVFFSLRENAFHCAACAASDTDVLLSPDLTAFLKAGEGPLTERQILAGIAVTLRLLRSTAGRLSITQSFEQFAQSATSLFHIDEAGQAKESCHEL